MVDGGGGRRGGGRGNRRSSHEAQSSSEYSSSYSQGRGSGQSADGSPNPNAAAYPRAADSHETQSEDDDSLVRPTIRLPPRRSPDPDATSDESEATEQDDDLPLVGHGKERRGKKGLSHAELALAGRHADATGSRGGMTATDQGEETEDEEEEDVVEMEVEPDDGGETEDDVEDYATVLQRANVRAAATRRRSPWAKCHPLVTEAAKMLEIRGAEPSDLGFAKLVGTGKVAVDYLVRKQSVVIGRSSALADCVIKSDSRLISRRHAQLFWVGERKEWVIHSLSEKNGILVNGIPVVPSSLAMPVKSRDLIEVGDAAFFFLAATAPIIRVNNIIELEKRILLVRAQEEKERAESEEEHRRKEARYGSLRQGRYLHPSRKFKEKLKKRKALESHREGSSNKRGYAVDGDSYGSGNARKRWKGHSKGMKGHRKRSSSGSNYPLEEEPREEDEGDPDVTEDEVESRHQPSPVKRADKKLGYGSSRRRTERGIQNSGDGREHGRRVDDEDSRYKSDWTKKERTDFTRALFAVGVDPVFEQDPVGLAYYDWTRFRKIAELSKKSDTMLEDYYLRVMKDVNDLLDDEEREKRTKGPRTKHKPGCDCIVCENTRKSRRKKQEERDGPFEDDRVQDSEGGEDGETKSTAKAKDKLVGLVTAQKLRVRLNIHEATRKADSDAGDTVFSRLSKQQDLHVRDMPRWWKAGYHDRALMLGAAFHGVGQWLDIWHDSKLRAFRKQKERHGEDVEWPTPQAAMKRVRDVASLINSELRRQEKRSAKGDHSALHHRDGRTKQRPIATYYSTEPKNKHISRRKKAHAPHRRESVESYHKVRSSLDRTADGDGDSTESGSGQDGGMEKRENAQIETEDEVEVEVEEEVEIEEEESGDEYGIRETPTSDAAGRGLLAEKKPVMAGGISTDEEEDEEDNIQYETASETGSD